MKSTLNIVDAPMHDEDSDYHFSQGSYFPPQFKIVAIFLLIAGLVLCVELNFIGLILLVLSTIALIAKKQLTISFSLSKQKNGMTFFGRQFGQWEPLPSFESISIFSAKKSQDMAVDSQFATVTFTEIEVNLVYNKNRRLTVFTTKDFNKALNIAQLFADKLALRIYDATQREGKWLD